MSDEWMVLLQLLVVGSVIGGLITWLLRSLMCKAKNEVVNKAILVTGCDSGIGHELAKHLDSLGFYVFAACLDTSSEGAQRLRYVDINQNFLQLYLNFQIYSIFISATNLLFELLIGSKHPQPFA